MRTLSARWISVSFASFFLNEATERSRCSLWREYSFSMSMSTPTASICEVHYIKSSHDVEYQFYNSTWWIRWSQRKTYHVIVHVTFVDWFNHFLKFLGLLDDSDTVVDVRLHPLIPRLGITNLTQASRDTRMFRWTFFVYVGPNLYEYTSTVGPRMNNVVGLTSISFIQYLFLYSRLLRDQDNSPSHIQRTNSHTTHI